MDIQDIKNKEPLIKDFFIWLFEDSRIINKNVNLQSEEDISLASFYFDSKIYFPEQIAKFFETKAMKRLSRISQLGISINEYPSAYHSRLEHSKGAYNRKLEEFLLNFENSDWRKYIENNNLKLYLLAELIKMSGHDIGHFPLSHAFEENIFNKFGIHEIIGKKILLEDQEIQELLISISPELPYALQTLFEKDMLNFSSHDEGNFDVDRLDYIGRDSLYCGKIINAKTIPYQTVFVKNDSNGVPITNEDLSIKTFPNFTTNSIDVYGYSYLNYIEEFLQLRFNNYKKIYISPETKISETALSSFFSIYLSENQEIGKDLYDFISYLKNIEPENISLNEFFKWDEIKFYSQIIEIAQKHKNKNIRNLATILIPSFKNFLYLMHSLLPFSKSYQYSEQDLEFLHKIKEIIKGNDEFSINIKNPNFLHENALLLNSSNASHIDKKYIYNCQYKLNGYNLNENPIYIRDRKNRIFELSQHPDRSLDWKNYTEILDNPCVYIPALRFYNVPEEQIKNLFNSQPMQNVINQHLEISPNIEDVFLEL